MRYLPLLLVLFLFGCEDYKPVWGEVIKCELTQDHYETKYLVDINGIKHDVTFATNIWLEPNKYKSEVLYEIQKDGSVKFEMEGCNGYKKRDIPLTETIVEATVISVIRAGYGNAIKLEVKSDAGSWTTDFCIDSAVFEGNKMLLTTHDDKCNLVAWQMKHVEHHNSGHFVGPVYMYD